MAVIVRKQISFFVSSNPASGAENLNALGNSFSVSLNSPISIPGSAVYCELGVSQASVWNTSANISPVFGNNVFAFNTSNAGNPGFHELKIDQGLYSLQGLNSWLSTQFVNMNLPSNLITLSGDDSTQRTVLTFLEPGDYADFTVADSCAPILGFDARLAPATPQAAGWNEYSDRSASFNRNNSYLITSDIISQGISVNNQGGGIIASVPIDQPPGSQVNFSPQHVIWSDAQELVGTTKMNFTMNLRNQDLDPVEMTSDYWTALIVIRYGVLLSGSPVPLLNVG